MKNVGKGSFDESYIERFMREYIEEKTECEELGRQKDEELIINFDINYPDGTTENITGGSESNIFETALSKNDKKFKCEKPEEIKKTKIKQSKLEENFVYNKANKYYTNEECKKNNNYYYDDECRKEEKRQEKEISGNVIVYSTLNAVGGMRIKGIKINLYRINGVSPELIISKETDVQGMVCFENIPEGNYRVVEIIDKNYFEKPVYINWNEVNICEDNEEFIIYIVNRIRVKNKC